MDQATRSEIEYNVHEDLRFPISFLHKALWVLENHGYTKFRKYATRINMPNQDIERVINKHKYNTEPEFRKAISKKCQYIKDKWGISIKP
jgi:hypothetical protein